MKRRPAMLAACCAIVVIGCTGGSLSSLQAPTNSELGTDPAMTGDAAGIDLRPVRDGGDVVSWRAYWPLDPKTFSTTEPLSFDIRCISGGSPTTASATIARKVQTPDDPGGPIVTLDDADGQSARIEFDTAQFTRPGRYSLTVGCTLSDVSFSFPFFEITAGEAPARADDEELARLLRTPLVEGGGAATFTAFGIDRTTVAPGSTINGRGACVNSKGAARTARISAIRNDGTGTEIATTSVTSDRSDGAFRFQLDLPAEMEPILHTLYLFCSSATFPPSASRLLTVNLPPTR